MVRNEIALLSKETIDQIAAGEVVERPASVVKELVENAIDAGATAITVEIHDGGISYIRITDNGCGIPAEQITCAFLRHSTSKLRCAEELREIGTLGFRGEALSSISAVSRVEMITKTPDALLGSRYVIEGSKEISFDEVGAPDGTTIFVYQLFYNTPARKKFLKTETTEAGYVAELMERLALSHPDISFCFINGKKERMHTAGNGNLMDGIYQIYGRQIATNLLPLSVTSDLLSIEGYIGNTSVARGNRSLENFYINGRYVKSPLLSKALEDGYVGYLMQHQYPFCVLSVTTKEAAVDVNVHPTKQEVRFDDEIAVAHFLSVSIHDRLFVREDIAEVTVDAKEEKSDDKAQNAFAISQEEQTSKIIKTHESPLTIKREAIKESIPEPFEKARLEEAKETLVQSIHADEAYIDSLHRMEQDVVRDHSNIERNTAYEQQSFLSERSRERHRIIGQVFDTYWMIEMGDKLYIMDQHAAHEKVIFERMMKQLRDKQMTSQQISPPIILSLSSTELLLYQTYQEAFAKIGYEISSFGGNEISIEGVPGNLFSFDTKQFFMEMLASCAEIKRTDNQEMVLEKVASMSCKAAVKGNNRLSYEEVNALMDELMELDNPYHCPHGRPTLISMTKYELEKKFKRIV